MPTSTITNTTKDPSGAVVPNVSVIITLFGTATNAPPSPVAGFRISDGSEVVQIVTVTSNASGVWSTPLEQNSNITPANTFYVAIEFFPTASGGPKYWQFTVGNANQTLQAALTSNPPALVQSSFLTQASGDARYVLSPGTFSGTVAAETIGAAGTSGAAASYSRGDHLHAMPAGAIPGTSFPGDTANIGVSASFALADHRHARENPVNNGFIPTSETGTSTTYTDLPTVGPTVTLTTRTTVLVIVGAALFTNTAGSAAFMSYKVSGATTIAASDTVAVICRSAVAGDGVQASMVSITPVTAGSNTFTAQYRVDGNTGTWSARSLIVIPLN